MNYFLSEMLTKVLLISVTFSVFEMAFVQKMKMLPIFKKDRHIRIFHFISSFVFGTVFSYWFFNLDIINGLWVSFFGYIGAPSIYETLKKQDLINYTPQSSNCDE